MALTRQQLIENINAMEEQGAEQDEVQAYINSVGQLEQPKPKAIFGGIKEDIGKRFGQIKESIGKTNFIQPYKGEITPQEAGLRTTGAVAGAVGDIAGRAIFGIGKAILPKVAEEKISQTASQIAETKPVQFAIREYKDWKSQNPRAAASLEATANIASLFPIGKGAQVAARPIGGAVKVAGEAAEITGRATQATGKALFGRAITPTVAEAEAIIRQEAKTPFLQRAKSVLTGTAKEAERPLRATTGIEKGLFGTEKMLGVQAKRKADELWTNKIAPAVKSSPVRVTKDDMFSLIEKRIGKTKELGKKKDLQDAYDAIKDDYKNAVDFSLEDAQKIKSELDAFTPEKVFRGKNVASEYATLKNDMANAIRQKTYSSLQDVKIKQDYLDWANLHELQKIGVNAITQAGTKGGFGGFWTTMWNMTTTPVKTVGGQVLYRVGNALEFVGDKGIKTFGSFLQNKGFKRPPIFRGE